MEGTTDKEVCSEELDRIQHQGFTVPHGIGVHGVAFDTEAGCCISFYVETAIGEQVANFAIPPKAVKALYIGLGELIPLMDAENASLKAGMN